MIRNMTHPKSMANLHDVNRQMQRRITEKIRKMDFCFPLKCSVHKSRGISDAIFANYSSFLARSDFEAVSRCYKKDNNTKGKKRSYGENASDLRNGVHVAATQRIRAKLRSVLLFSTRTRMPLGRTRALHRVPRER